MLTDFSHYVERQSSRVHTAQLKLRMLEVAVFNSNQIPVLTRRKVNLHLAQPFERAPKAAFGSPRPVRHTSQFPVVTCEEADDQVCFLERIGSKHDRFAGGQSCRLTEKAKGPALSSRALRGFVPRIRDGSRDGFHEDPGTRHCRRRHNRHRADRRSGCRESCHPP